MSASKDVYLVLGGDVFAGRHVVEQLKARGDTVFVFDSTQRHDDVECYSGDICVRGQVSDVIQKTGATCVIHTISPLSIRNRDNLSILHQVNVEGTKCVIAAAKAAGVRKLIYHTSDLLGIQEVFSPWDQEMIVGFYDSWKHGTTHVQLGANKNLTDRTYAGNNIAHAMLLASDKLSDPVVSEQVSGQTFFITNNDRDSSGILRVAFGPDSTESFPIAPSLLRRTQSQFVAWLRGGKDQLFTPYTVTFATAKMYFNSAKARRVLGYEPQVGVDEWIERTLTWFKAEHDAGKFK
ncbi:hypothetical protein C8R47DRAFT_1071913 [Mycena vitilis]|nr:hypothetical protein C8R47DRAFT_1071913 [Mycena vitilis]